MEGEGKVNQRKQSQTTGTVRKMALAAATTKLAVLSKSSGEANADDSDDSQANPLMIESILEVLFGKLNDKELKKCRAVCKIWLKEVDRLVHRRKEITISTAEELTNFARGIKTSTDIVIGISIGGMKVGKYISLDTPLWTQVLKFVKPTLKTLTMDGIFMTYRSYCNMIRIIGSSPTLEKLELGTLKTENKTYHRYFPVMISEGSTIPMNFPNITSLEFLSFNDNSSCATKLSLLIPHFPNLKILIAQNIYPEKSEKFKNLRLEHLEHLELRLIPYKDIEHVLPLPGMLNLVGRRVRYMNEGGLFDEHLRCFINMNLTKLKRFGVVNINANLSEGVFRKFLEPIKNTLVEIRLINLNIFCEPTTSPTPTPFPMDFSSLRTAAIDRPFIRNFGAALRSMPKLDELELKFPMEEGVNVWGRILPAKLPEFNSLKILILTAQILPKHLTALAKAFTGLTSFKTSPCDNDLLRVIIVEMKGLEHLIISDEDKLTDEGFTGIQMPVLRNYASGMLKGKLSKFRVFPFIGDMKNLKTLTLVGESRNVSHKSLGFGIAGMKNLLSVSMKGIEKVKQKTMLRMRKSGFVHFGTSTTQNQMFYLARDEIFRIIMSFPYGAFGRYLMDSTGEPGYSNLAEEIALEYAQSRLNVIRLAPLDPSSESENEDDWEELN